MPNLVVYNRLCGVFLVCAIATLFSQPVAAQKTTAQDVKYTGSRALYAPYWYVDNATDSYLEIKSHVQKMPITVLPTVTISDGRRVKLTSVRVLPLATVRVSIRSELMKAHVNFPAKRISKVTVWGDGSRLHSLIGAIKVDLVSPRTARGADFNGWVLVENPSERLGTMSMLENPSVSRSSILEGLWWAPVPETQVYFALQNIGQSPVKILVTIFDQTHAILVKSLKMPAQGSTLLNILQLLGAKSLPEVGSVTLNSAGAPPGTIIARGRLFEAKTKFSAAWRLQESISRADKLFAQSELHAPAAYFGKLNRLSHSGEAYLHPHLLLKNVSKRRVTASVTVHGRDLEDKPARLDIKPFVVDPDATLHLDLEQNRKDSGRAIADGAAGIRIVHDGRATDLVAELLNVDETGHVVLYDDVRIPLLHQATMQSAVSFNLEDDRQPFLIIKNTTDEPHDARIVLDYHEGKDHYEMDLKGIAPQQNEIIDLRHLRDAKIPDVNGNTLFSDVTFGGYVIFSDPGAFVISDPTLVYGHSTDPGGADPPDGDPFFLPSCGRDLSNSNRGAHDYPRDPMQGDCIECGGCTLAPESRGGHRGRDIVSNPRGTFGEPVYAMEDGKLIDLGVGVPGGRFSAVILQKRGFLTIYGHVRPLDSLETRRGQIIRQGEQIGVTDNTGEFDTLTGRSHVHVARVRSLGGQQDDYPEAALRAAETGDCIFSIPCPQMDCRSGTMVPPGGPTVQ